MEKSHQRTNTTRTFSFAFIGSKNRIYIVQYIHYKIFIINILCLRKNYLEN
jgi:hypothetical protein